MAKGSMIVCCGGPNSTKAGGKCLEVALLDKYHPYGESNYLRHVDAGMMLFKYKPLTIVVSRGLVSKENVVLRRWGSRNECLVLLTKLIRYFGHRKEIGVLKFWVLALGGGAHDSPREFSFQVKL